MQSESTMTLLRFIHISDTHVGPNPDFTLWGYSPYRALETLVAHINALPFQPDFVLHTGDIVQDGSDESYALTLSTLAKLCAPIYYLPGNHDNPQALQRIWLGDAAGKERFDYAQDFGSVRLLALDTRRAIAPGERLPDRAAGTLTKQQLAALRQACEAGGPRLIVALHHQPVTLDSIWLDEGFDDDGVFEAMMLDCADPFLAAIAPARERICGVFFGHVHRAFQVIRDGVLFSSAPSAFVQFQSFPGQTTPVKTDDLPGYALVTVQDEQTIVRQYTFPRPAGGDHNS